MPTNTNSKLQPIHQTEKSITDYLLAAYNADSQNSINLVDIINLIHIARYAIKWSTNYRHGGLVCAENEFTADNDDKINDNDIKVESNDNFVKYAYAYGNLVKIESPSEDDITACAKNKITDDDNEEDEEMIQ